MALGYDNVRRRTETLWQQITGESIVRDFLGAKLRRVSAQIISFEQFRSLYTNALVLSRKTGYQCPAIGQFRIEVWGF